MDDDNGQVGVSGGGGSFDAEQPNATTQEQPYPAGPLPAAGAPPTTAAQSSQPAQQLDWTTIAQQLPFSQPDALSLQRYTYGLGDVLRQVSSGDLTQEEANPTIDELMRQIIPLSQRQQQTKALQQQEQQQELFKQLAVQQSVKAQNTVHDADNFAANARHITNPETGELATFVPTKPDHFERVDWTQAATGGQGGGESEPAEADIGEPTPVGTNPQMQPMPTNGPPLTQAQIAAGGRVLPDGTVSYSPKDRDAYVPGGAVGIEAARQGGPLSIQSGPYTEQYQDGRLVSSNRPPAPTQADENQQEGYLSAHERNLNRNKAEQDYARMPEGPRKRQAVAAAEEHYNERTARSNRDVALQQNRQTREAQKQAAAEKKAGVDKVDQEGVKYFDAHMDKIQTRIDKLRDEGKSGADIAKQFPEEPWLSDPDAHLKKAQDDTERVMKSNHPEWVPPWKRNQPAQSGSPTAAPQGGQTAPAQGGTPVPKAIADRANAQAAGTPKPDVPPTVAADQRPSSQAKPGDPIYRRKEPSMIGSALGDVPTTERVGTMSEVGPDEVNQFGIAAQDAFNQNTGRKDVTGEIGNFAGRVAARLGVGSTTTRGVKDALDILTTAKKEGRGLMEHERDEYSRIVSKLPQPVADRLKLGQPIRKAAMRPPNG